MTPILFDLTDREGLDALQRYDLGRLVEPAASEEPEGGGERGGRRGVASEVDG